MADLLTLSTALVCVAVSWLVISPWQRKYVKQFDRDPRFQRVLDAGPQLALTAVGCVAVLAWGNVDERWLAICLALPVMTLLLAAGSVDVVCKRLPNRLLVWAGVFSVVSTLVLAFEAPRWQSFLTQVVVAWMLVTGIAFLLFCLPSGMGAGDVKLVAVFGIWLGAFDVMAPLYALTGGFLLAAPVAVGVLVLKKTELSTEIPFGPFLVCSSVVVWRLVL